jgi:hypothetical protein
MRLMVTMLPAVGLLLTLGAVLMPEAPAAAHEERDSAALAGSGAVPSYHSSGPQILVCHTDRADFMRRVAGFPPAARSANLALFDRCQADGVRNVQDAVNDARQPGTRVRILPGVYREAPGLVAASPACAAIARRPGEDSEQVLSWQEQVACPHAQNLVAVLGKRGLQIEGTGAGPGDVVIDAGFKKLNALFADRSPGIYLRNFTVESTTGNAVYIRDTDGFVIDRLVARWDSGYGFNTFGVDHGLYSDCEAYGNGEAGLYAGAVADINRNAGLNVRHYAVEIRHCRSHNNLLGYSGTAGDSVWVHDNEFTANGAGISMDSVSPGHPGLPQNHAKFERNNIHGNNTDYYRYVRNGTCAKAVPERGYERGVVCPGVGIAVGAGVITAGGNFNTFRDNWVYDQDYAAFVLFWVPAEVPGGSYLSTFDTSHHNRYVGNHLGRAPDGATEPNRLDVWWDGQGIDNRWQAARSSPFRLPGLAGPSTNRLLGDPFRVLMLVQCQRFDPRGDGVPVGCDWYGGSWFTRLDVIAVTFQSTLFVVAGILLLIRRLPRRRLSYAVTAAGILGAIADVAGTAAEGTAIGALASALLASWWLGAGILMYQQHTYRRLAALTLVLGGLSLLQAVDRGFYMLPYIPVSLGWPILVLGIVWAMAT